MTATTTENLTTEQIQSIIRLADRRNVLLELDGEKLRVRGEPSAVAVLRPWLTKGKTAIVEYLKANPSPVVNPTQSDKGQGERGGEADRSSATSSAPTPLSILSQLHLAGQFIPGMPAAIDLALWLTEAHQNCQRDGSGNVVDAGIVIDPEGRPVNVAQTVAALARGPQSQGNRQTETPASWLERIAKFKALADELLKWRASTGWRSAEWPAEAKIKTKSTVGVVPPKANPVERKAKVTTP